MRWPQMDHHASSPPCKRCRAEKSMKNVPNWIISVTFVKRNRKSCFMKEETGRLTLLDASAKIGSIRTRTKSRVGGKDDLESMFDFEYICSCGWCCDLMLWHAGIYSRYRPTLIKIDAGGGGGGGCKNCVKKSCVRIDLFFRVTSHDRKRLIDKSGNTCLVSIVVWFFHQLKLTTMMYTQKSDIIILFHMQWPDQLCVVMKWIILINVIHGSDEASAAAWLRKKRGWYLKYYLSIMTYSFGRAKIFKHGEFTYSW